MVNLKKLLCIIFSAVIIFGVFSGNTVAATKATMIKLEIVNMPVKTVFVKEKDWIYGVWNISETTGEPILVASDKISFTHNPCSGLYPERGMLDMTGLSIKVSYSDGTSKILEYTETLNKNGSYSTNILVSPKGGYSVGINTVEVYLAENTKYYDSYQIEITETDPDEKPYKALSSECAVVDYDALCVYGLSSGLTRAKLESDIFDFGDAEATFTKAKKDSRYYGTGSTLTLTHYNGTVETFTLIVPGDVDGNGIVNFDDVAIVSCAVGDSSILTQTQEKAAEVDGIRRITANDVSCILQMING